MCGRYSLFSSEENQEIMRIVKSIDQKYPGTAVKRGEIFPTNQAPILQLENNKIMPELSTWGVPRFNAKGVIINARSETADERPMFRKSLHMRRCVVPSTGFFEWSQDEQKIKYQFTMPDQDALYMAGIFNEFQEEKQFVILTTKANLSISDVHNRMPVILPKDKIEDWLMTEEFAIPYLHASMPALNRKIAA